MPSALDIGRPTLKRGIWQTMECEVTAAQTFKVGDWVYKDAAGTLAIAATDTNIVDSSAIQLFGRALANAADILALDAGRRLCPVEVPIGPGAQFISAPYHATAASATLAQTDVDGAAAACCLPLVNIGGQWAMDKATDGTDDCVMVMERHSKYPWSETFGWFWCSILDSALQSALT